MKDIKPSDISVVLQGPVNNLTPGALKSVRRFLPGAEIILSTWKGSAVNGLDYDKLILSCDPYLDSQKQYPTNLNRMLVSSLAGVRAVKRKYTLKMRTDFEITGCNFIKLFCNSPAVGNEMKLFIERVVCFAWKPQPGRLLQVGDFFFFGLTEDITSLFEIPLSTDGEFFYLKNNTPSNAHLLSENPNRFHPEQHIWINFLRKSGVDASLRDYTDYNEEMKVLTEKSFINNLVFSSFYEFSISTRKRNLLRYNFPIQKRCYKFSDWVFLYRKYIDKGYIPIYVPPFPSKPKFITVKIVSALGRFLAIFMPVKKYRRKIRFLVDKSAIYIFYGTI